jgi:hypothetical protein
MLERGWTQGAGYWGGILGVGLGEGFVRDFFGFENYII